MSDTPTVVLDPSLELLSTQTSPLHYMFKPRNVALIGATEKQGSVGRTVLKNLINSPFGGAVYPVNPKRPHVLGIHAHKSIKDIPEPIDLAVICTAAKIVPSVVKESVEAGVKGIIVISAGFKEMGKEGEKLEAQILDHIKDTDVRIIGPNCLGIMNPLSGLNATFGADMALPGKVAFISQSGALCTAILDWSIRENIGFSSFVSIGSMADVDWGDLITFFGNDPETNAIVIYMESVGNASSFLSAAREVAINKPIIVIKAGRTDAAAKAAASHTGSLTGSDDVLDAAFKRAGVMRVNDIKDLFAISQLLANQPIPNGRHLTIVTNAGGPGVLAADALCQGDGELTEISKKTLKELDELLPPHWSKNNPIDVLGDATPEVYAKTLAISADDPEADGLLVILTPQDMTDPTKTAEALTPYAHSLGKPVLASWMGGTSVAKSRRILQKAGIPSFEHPDDACQAFNYLWQYRANLDSLYETPESKDDPIVLVEGRKKAKAIIDQVRADNRTLLNEYESKKLLNAYGIPTIQTEIALTQEEAVKHANEIGYPIVLKLHSNTVTHKTDVGGVQLNLQNEEEIKTAFNAIKEGVTQAASAKDFLGVTVQPMANLDGYEIIFGSSVDPQFGPVLLFGTGGSLVELYEDRALGLPPLTGTTARRMMASTKIYKALKGVRGRPPVDLLEMDRLLVRFSSLIAHEKWIAELDINPLLVSHKQIVALDARVVLHDLNTPEDKLPRPSIRPYPIEYVSQTKLKDGQEVTIRPIRPEDENAMIDFHKGLSEQTVLNCFHKPLDLKARIAHNRLLQVCSTDYARTLTFIATKDTNNNNRSIFGVCRLQKDNYNPQNARLTLVVSDKFQNTGVGELLLKASIKAAKADGIVLMRANILKDNTAGIELCRSNGAKVSNPDENNLVYIEFKM